MLIVFRSKGAGDVRMFAEHAMLLLDAIGKPFQLSGKPQGILTAPEVPAALARLRAAAENARRDRSEAEKPGEPVPIGFSQRAFPLIELLERAEKTGNDVVWGT